MKEKGFSPKPEETEVVLPPSDFGGEFMAAWLHRRKKNPENTENDDEDEETEAPKSRFSKLFKKLFPRIAARQQVGSETPSKVSLNELFIPAQSEEAIDKNLPDKERDDELRDEIQISSELELSKAKESSLPVGNDNEVAARLKNPEEPIVRRIEKPATVTLRNAEATNNMREIAESTIFERRTEIPPITREQVIERRVAEPLAVLEYFLRRRAVKNVERQVKKESANLEKKLRQSNESNERLQGLSKKSQEQLQELRAKRQSVEKPIIEKVENTKTERVIERSSPIKAERVIEKQEQAEHIKPKIEASEYRIKEVPIQPERVLEQVLQAAEKNTPIEKLYERRHETKDEPSKFDAGLSGGAVPIGSVIAQSYQQKSSNNQQSPLANTANSTTKQSSMYKQAAVSGFWAALVLLVGLAVMIMMGS